MQELTSDEIDQVNGGLLDLAIAFFRSVTGAIDSASDSLSNGFKIETVVDIRG